MGFELKLPECGYYKHHYKFAKHKIMLLAIGLNIPTNPENLRLGVLDEIRT